MKTRYTSGYTLISQKDDEGNISYIRISVLNAPLLLISFKAKICWHDKIAYDIIYKRYM